MTNVPRINSNSQSKSSLAIPHGLPDNEMQQMITQMWSTQNLKSALAKPTLNTIKARI